MGVYIEDMLILGGSGNMVPAGCTHVGIFGCNITTVCDNTFHTNCIVVQNMPITGNPLLCSPPPLAIPGTLYYVPIAPGGFCQVWIA
jgi:hypothetical protein